MAETFLTNSEQALTELTDILVRAKEIAISQASGASSNAETRLGVAEEVTPALSAGRLRGQSPHRRSLSFRRLQDAASPRSIRTGRYHGDDGQMMVEIAQGCFHLDECSRDRGVQYQSQVRSEEHAARGYNRQEPERRRQALGRESCFASSKGCHQRRRSTKPVQRTSTFLMNFKIFGSVF